MKKSVCVFFWKNSKISFFLGPNLKYRLKFPTFSVFPPIAAPAVVRRSVFWSVLLLCLWILDSPLLSFSFFFFVFAHCKNCRRLSLTDVDWVWPHLKTDSLSPLPLASSSYRILLQPRRPLICACSLPSSLSNLPRVTHPALCERKSFLNLFLFGLCVVVISLTSSSWKLCEIVPDISHRFW